MNKANLKGDPGKADKGIYAASITPIDANGEPDGARLVEHCRWLLEQRLSGVAPLGTTGEGNSLPLSFRLTVPALFRDAGIASNQVIFGTGSCSTGDAILATRAVVQAGYVNALVLPPFYYKNASEDGLFNYFAKLIDGVGSDQLRVYLYHFPQLSMSPITVPLIQRLRAEFGSIIAGLKDSSGDFKGTLDFVNAAADFDVFSGSEAFLLEGIQKGCAGAISATTNASATLAAATLSADGENADRHQKTLSAIRLAIGNFPLSAALKQIEAWRREDDSWLPVLPPNTTLSTEQVHELRGLLEALEPAAGVLVQQRQAS